MIRHLLLLVILPLAAALSSRVAAQVVSLGGYAGCVDTTTHRILISTSDGHAPVSLPPTADIGLAGYTLQTTTLPIVFLDHSQLAADTFRPGTLTLIVDGTINITTPVQLRYRGVTALGYDKKSYAVKLLDDDGTPRDASLLGMRTDNSWILDAMAADPSRMRNRVSTDIWLDFSTPPCYADQEPAISNGTHGKFVEVFIGSRYWGIYCLTEKIDRKQLRLKKYKDNTPRGLLYKSTDHDNLHTLTHPQPSPIDPQWQGWKADYPDPTKQEPFDWTPLYDLATFFSQPIPSDDVARHLDERVDLPLWIDYILFCDMASAHDNTDKNQYLYLHDLTTPLGTPSTSTRLSICPWDLDATFGRAYDTTIVSPETNCNVNTAVNYHLLFSYPDGYYMLCQRWAQLRRNTFTPQHLNSYFTHYYQLFHTSGADTRETERWDGANGLHLDLQKEADYIAEWITHRLQYLDNDYDNSTESLDRKKDLSTFSDYIYTIDGRKVQQKKITSAEIQQSLPPGLYIFKKNKIIIR